MSRSREGQGPIQSPIGMARLMARTLEEETEDQDAIYNPKSNLHMSNCWGDPKLGVFRGTLIQAPPAPSELVLIRAGGRIILL